MKASLLLSLTFLLHVVREIVAHSEYVELLGHDKKEHVLSMTPKEYLQPDDLPESFVWGNLTKSLNQHIPQYCGSCWAHGALSALADRIKIARNYEGTEINLSVQFLLNCGRHVAGSCHGGSPGGVHQFIKETGYIPYDTCAPYLACSADSDFGGFCDQVDTSCSSFNTCRTCSMKIVPSIHPFREKCSSIVLFPNATLAEYGSLDLFDDVIFEIQAEIFARGPVVAGVNGQAIHDYQGGVFRDTTADRKVTHVVELVGWATDDEGVFWIARNSWGQYWGELGMFRIGAGENIAGIESGIWWATPGSWTVVNYPCDESDDNCVVTEHHKDPSQDLAAVRERVEAIKRRS